MELTVAYLRERFRALNALYFDDQLPLPQLQVSRARTQLGQFSCMRFRKNIFSKATCTNFKIKISEYYEQTADEIDDTLLHEMIHYLIAFRGQRDASAHGPLFRVEMARLNALGRHITISVRTASFSPAVARRRRQHLVLAMQDNRGRFFLSVVHPAYRVFVERQLQQAPTIVAHQWQVSNSDYFDTFPQVRSLRARRVSRADYSQFVDTGK